MMGQPGNLQLTGEIIRPSGSVKITLTCEKQRSTWLARLSRLISYFLPATLTHEVATRNAIADAVVDLLDVGSVNPTSRLRIYTTGGITLLATVLMANPTFGAAVSGVAAGLSLPWSDDAAPGSGVAAEFDMIDRDETVILRGDVAISGEEVSFTDLEIAALDIVKINTATYTACP
jgi:hypothetical protein